MSTVRFPRIRPRFRGVGVIERHHRPAPCPKIRLDMRLPSLVRPAIAAGLICAACLAVAKAQQSDADAVARWAAATVVHYHMVGVYDGATVVAYREPAGTATVTDRVELD